MTMAGDMGQLVGLGTEKLQAYAPKLHKMIQDYGRDVAVFRHGQPPVMVKAAMWQEEAGGQGSVADPKFKLAGWQAVFIWTATSPVAERGFYLVDYTGRVFLPVADVQDILQQNVILWGHFQPLPERTALTVLHFDKAGGLVEVAGRWVKAAGQPIDVTVRLTATRDPAILDRLGADAAALVYEGRWGDLLTPQRKPAALEWGDSAPMDVDGQAGRLTLRLAYADPDQANEDQFGSRFIATWQATT